MADVSALGFVFLTITLVGFYFAYLYGRKTKEFRWSEYAAIVIWPVACVLLMGFYLDVGFIYLFILSAIVGFVLEYGIGFVYHKTLNQRLWRYNRLDINGYTSLLSIPLWGIAGIVFWFLGKFVGL